MLNDGSLEHESFETLVVKSGCTPNRIAEIPDSTQVVVFLKNGKKINGKYLFQTGHKFKGTGNNGMVIQRPDWGKKKITNVEEVEYVIIASNNAVLSNPSAKSSKYFPEDLNKISANTRVKLFLKNGEVVKGRYLYCRNHNCNLDEAEEIVVQLKYSSENWITKIEDIDYIETKSDREFKIAGEILFGITDIPTLSFPVS